MSGELAISPLGTYGLGAMGGYGSYDAYMPSSYMSGMGAGMGMGMTDPSIFGMGLYGMGGYGMNAMLQYPLLYGQMQAQMENNQLNHAVQMQQGVNQYAVSAHSSSDKALIQKIMNNGDIQYNINNLRQKVVEGDQKGIMSEFDKIRNAILNTYSNEFDKMGTNINRVTTANEIIKRVYSATVSAQTNEVVDLEEDIVKYGQGSFGAGFMDGFRAGSHGRYTDQTLQYCFGRDIDQKKYKDEQKTFGKAIGSGASILEKGAWGAIVGVGGAATISGINKLLGINKVSNRIIYTQSGTRKILGMTITKPGFLKSLKAAGKIGLVAGLAYGVYELCTRKSSTATA